MGQNNIFAALLLAAATLSLAACSEKESNNESQAPQPRVVRVYAASHTLGEMYNAAADTWVTLFETTRERHLIDEFFYTGDRLDSIVEHSDPSAYVTHFTYDDQGRLATACSNWNRYTTFSYDADGRLSHTYSYGLDQGDTSMRTYVDYTWDGNRLMRAELERTAHNDANDVSKHETHLYTWNGDNVATVDCYSLDRISGQRDTTNYTFEFTSAPNPFYGFPHWMSLGDGGGIIWNFNGIDGICRNIPAHITESMSDYTFDVTTSGDRTTSVTIHHLSDDPNANPRMRITAESTSEFEYEN